MSQPVSSEGRLARETARVGVNVGILFAARIIGMAMALVQSGIVFRALSLEGQGEFGAALGFASAFTVPATFGIQRLLVRDIARNRAIAWDYVWTGVVATGGLSAACLAAIWLLRMGSSLQSAAFWAGLWVVFLWAVQQPFESLLMAYERLGRIAAMNVVVGALKLLAVYLLLDFPDTAASGAFEPVHTATAARAHAVIALANGVGLMICIALAIHTGGWQRPHLRPSAALAQIRDSMPFATAMLCSWVYFKSDIVLLEWFRGAREAGIYAPPQRLMEPLLMVASLWGTAVFPALCRLSHTDVAHYDHLKATSLRLALLLACPIGMGVAVLAHPIMLLLTGDAENAAESALVLQVLTLVVPLFYFNGIGQELLYAAGRNAYTVASLAAAAAVSLALNLVAIPRYGVLGLVAVAIAANFTVSACYWYGMRRDLARARLAGLILRSLFACAIMGAVAWWLAAWSLLLAVAGGAAVYVALHAALGTLDPGERAMFRHAVEALAQRFQRRR